MKRTALLTAALILSMTALAHAQALTMQMSNGWTFSFSGNVNAFLVFETEGDDGEIDAPVALVGAGRQGTAIRTGLLPTFAVIEAAGRENNLDLKVHFGFAPQIQTPGGHDNFGNGTQAGAQIDMRQVYMTVGGEWGQILAGREIGVYQRQNILNDQTLFGTGATGGNFSDEGGTTLGRIGFGYVYPNFNAQFTYSSPADRPAQITIGLFDPDRNNEFDEIVLPRLESELVYNAQQLMLFGGLLAQHQKDTDPDVDESKVAWGLHGGGKYGGTNVSVVASGYYGQGIGTTLMFLGGRSDTEVAGARSTELRPSYGFIGQVTVTPANSRMTLGASFGQSTLKSADDEPEAKLHNRSLTGGLYFQQTDALKLVGEFTYAMTADDDDATENNNSIVLSAGMMLFF